MLDVVFGAGDAEGRATIFAGIAERRRSLDRSAHSPFRFPGRLPLALRPRRRRAIEALDDAIEARLAGGLDSVLADLSSTADASAAGARDEAVSLGVAGYETVGQGLAWCLHAVTEAPEVLRRLRDEVDLLGDTPPAASDLDRLRYATACFEEAMRVRPPSWIVVRNVLREDTLPSGARLAPGARVYASQWVTHRDPRLHPEPERFDPERFLDGGAARGAVYAYFPFGAGPRDCIGRGLAMLEGALVLARVVQRISFEPPAQPPRLDAGMGSVPRAGCRWSRAGAETRGLQSARGGRHWCECVVRSSLCCSSPERLRSSPRDAVETTSPTRRSLLQRQRRRTAAAKRETRRTASRSMPRPAVAAATRSRPQARPARSGLTSTTPHRRSTSW